MLNLNIWEQIEKQSNKIQKYSFFKKFEFKFSFIHYLEKKNKNRQFQNNL